LSADRSSKKVSRAGAWTKKSSTKQPDTRASASAEALALLPSRTLTTRRN
jgi:hypothetical protein